MMMTTRVSNCRLSVRLTRQKSLRRRRRRSSEVRSLWVTLTLQFWRRRWRRRGLRSERLRGRLLEASRRRRVLMSAEEKRRQRYNQQPPPVAQAGARPRLGTY